MKKRHFNVMMAFLILLITGETAFCQQFPVTFNADSLVVAKNNVSQWHGKIVSTECTVNQIEEEYEEKPYYRCAYSDGSSICIASLLQDKDSIHVEDRVKLLGFFTKIEDRDLLPFNFHNEGIHLMTFGVVNLTEHSAYFLRGADAQFEEWKNGVITQTGP